MKKSYKNYVSMKISYYICPVPKDKITDGQTYDKKTELQSGYS